MDRRIKGESVTSRPLVVEEPPETREHGRKQDLELGPAAVGLLNSNNVILFEKLPEVARLGRPDLRVSVKERPRVPAHHP